jgi:hypothetical protein
MGLLIIKNHLSMQFVESLWMKHLCSHLCPKLVFFQEIFLELVEKIKQLHVLLILVECNFAIANFDLWISKGMHDIFVFVINFGS